MSHQARVGLIVQVCVCHNNPSGLQECDVPVWLELIGHTVQQVLWESRQLL